MIQLHRVPASAESALVEMARTLVSEYAAMPHTAVRWPNAAADIARLPEPFLPPAGMLLVGTDGDAPVGCGALLAFDPPQVAEIKRVYVRPVARGRGVGETIMRALLAEAARLGFERARLDTAPELLAAQELYRRLGFVPIPHYRDTQLPGDLCFECDVAGFRRDAT